MQLKQMGSSSSSCELPDWMRKHRKYHNLDMTEEFHINHAGTSLEISHKDLDNGNINSKDNDKASNINMKCHEILENSTNHTKLVMVSNIDCSSGFKCLEVFRKTDDVLSVRIGRLSRNSQEACHQQLFFDPSIPVKTITSAHHHNKPCPLMGRYKVAQPTSSKCSKTPSFLLASCKKPSRIQKVHQCSGDGGDPTVNTEDFVCHDTWKEGSSTEDLVEYTIISPLARSSNSAKRLCLKRQQNKDSDESQLVAKIKDCYSSSSDQSWAYKIRKTGSCAPVALATANGGHLVRLSLMVLFISGTALAM